MYPEFLAGNIRDTPLEKIWKNSPVLREIRSLSVSKIPECKDCHIRYMCSGGCLIDIYWEHKNLSGKTPQCDLLHAMVWDELKQMEYRKKSMNCSEEK